MKLKLQLVEDGTPTVSMSVHNPRGEEIATRQLLMEPSLQYAVAAEIQKAFATMEAHSGSTADLLAVLGSHFGATVMVEPNAIGAVHAETTSGQDQGTVDHPLELEVGSNTDRLHVRADNGNLDADKLAQLYGFSLAEMATYVGVTRQALAKKTDSERYQEKLAMLETIAGVMSHLGGEPKAFRIWLKKPQRGTGNKMPRELILGGQAQDIETAVTRMLSGEPS